MELVNATPAIAHLFPVNLLEPEIRAAVIVKKTYALDASFRVEPEDDAMPLVLDRLANDYGVFHGEIFFRKRGVDVCVLGTARFERPVRRANVRLEIGSNRHELRLIGDRVWERLPSGALGASGPQPFNEMPLSYARAYGGATEIDGEEVAWPDNPTGRGYYESPKAAVGRPLPNIEPVNWSGSAWNDRIPVAGWAPYPMFWGLRPRGAVKVDERTGELLDLTPEIFNNAHPDLIVDDLDAAAPLRITGMLPHPIAVQLPRERPAVSVAVGTETFDALGDLDGVFLWLDARRLVLTWRVRFRYPVRTEQVRRARLSFVE
jgi:hypothetical protein